jgi:hypothetical protein
MIQDVIEEKTDSVEIALKDIARETEQRNPPPPLLEETLAIVKEDPPPVVNKPAYASDDFIDAATDTAFAILDNAQETAFTILANNKKRKRAIQIAGDSGVAKLMEVKSAAKNNLDYEKTTENLKLLNLDATVDEFVKDLAFTPKQIEMMRPGLKLMVEKNAGRIPPELLFYAGLATAIGGNLAEYYTF